MINIYIKHTPLRCMHIPTDWLVVKNNMYDVAPEFLRSISSNDELFITIDTFFKNDIFVAQINLPISTKKNVLSMVSIYARLQGDIENKESLFCIYDIELSVILGGENYTVTKENGATNRYDAAKIASEYMFIFSQYIFPELISNKKLKTEDVSFMLNFLYEKRNIIGCHNKEE